MAALMPQINAGVISRAAGESLENMGRCGHKLPRVMWGLRTKDDRDLKHHSSTDGIWRRDLIFYGWRRKIRISSGSAAVHGSLILWSDQGIWPNTILIFWIEGIGIANDGFDPGKCINFKHTNAEGSLKKLHDKRQIKKKMPPSPY